jgi:hypothetical protein
VCVFTDVGHVCEHASESMDEHGFVQIFLRSRAALKQRVAVNTADSSAACATCTYALVAVEIGCLSDCQHAFDLQASPAG